MAAKGWRAVLHLRRGHSDLGLRHFEVALQPVGLIRCSIAAEGSVGRVAYLQTINRAAVSNFLRGRGSRGRTPLRQGSNLTKHS